MSGVDRRLVWMFVTVMVVAVVISVALVWASYSHKQTATSAAGIWERIGSYYDYTYRMPVKGGWLVRHGNKGHLVFVPDSEHMWEAKRW